LLAGKSHKDICKYIRQTHPESFFKPLVLDLLTEKLVRMGADKINDSLEKYTEPKRLTLTTPQVNHLVFDPDCRKTTLQMMELSLQIQEGPRV
jgi:hypothetical protein